MEASRGAYMWGRLRDLPPDWESHHEELHGEPPPVPSTKVLKHVSILTFYGTMHLD